ncbi:hypothetical protein, partial [Streptomyces malaysiensis]|uniref:hypothetical protein n=1 Tax=Streptomyces malaysiensis TaxID=92644 RepID=UPI001F4690CE
MDRHADRGGRRIGGDEPHVPGLASADLLDGTGQRVPTTVPSSMARKAQPSRATVIRVRRREEVRRTRRVRSAGVPGRRERAV